MMQTIQNNINHKLEDRLNFLYKMEASFVLHCSLPKESPSSFYGPETKYQFPQLLCINDEHVTPDVTRI